jgi:hypothetical protein
LLPDSNKTASAKPGAVHESLAFYIDYEKMGRDLELGGDIFTIEAGYREVHIFWNH